jgi:hypothetical protein
MLIQAKNASLEQTVPLRLGTTLDAIQWSTKRNPNVASPGKRDSNMLKLVSLWRGVQSKIVGCSSIFLFRPTVVNDEELCSNLITQERKRIE